MSEYQKKAEQFIQENGIEFRAGLIGNDCPTFCQDALADRDMDKIDVYPRKSHIHGKHYRVTFSKKGKGHLAIDFWNSYADEEHNAKKRGEYGNPGYYDWQVKAKARKEPKRIPTPYDVLACIQKDDPGTFENFCGDFGYDTDSRRAEDIYHAVQKEYQRTVRFFTPEELDKVREIQWQHELKSTDC